MLKRLAVEMSELAASAMKARKDSHTELVIFLLKASWLNLDTHRSLRDAAADDADMRRYARTCSRARKTMMRQEMAEQLDCWA